jgi:hypothetical protein
MVKRTPTPPNAVNCEPTTPRRVLDVAAGENSTRHRRIMVQHQLPNILQVYSKS